jgi:hypothetical protein
VAASVVLALLLLLTGTAHAYWTTEDFYDGPPSSRGWVLKGEWRWNREEDRLDVANNGYATALWKKASLRDGFLRVAFRLVPGESPRARVGLFFACAPDGASRRFVAVVPGRQAKVVVGQEGRIGDVPQDLNLASAAVALAEERWYRLTVAIRPRGGLDVYLEGGNQPRARLLTVPGLPPARGRAGIFANNLEASFDDFAYFPTREDGAMKCLHCHAGYPPADKALAPDVMTYWDGSWWDAQMGGGRRAQQGGHGDPDGLERGNPDLLPVCQDCHDITDPEGTHDDGILSSALRGINRNGNTAHLRSYYFGAESQPYDVQVNFDRGCWERCHRGLGLRNHRHSQGDTIVRFGLHGSISDADTLPGTIPYPVDSDLTTRASTADPDFAPCVSCHDPHGTGVSDVRGGGTGPAKKNAMLRDTWWSSPNTLCKNCH